jgi:hypothetical protein
MTKNQIFASCEKVTPEPKYQVQELADKFESGDFNIKILMLPVAHPELNPIEHIWGVIKRVVASQNLSCNLKEVERLTMEQIESFTGSEGWGKNRRFLEFVKNAKKHEGKYREMARMQDNLDDDATAFDEDGDDDYEKHELFCLVVQRW